MQRLCLCVRMALLLLQALVVFCVLSFSHENSTGGDGASCDALSFSSVRLLAARLSLDEAIVTPLVVL